MSSRPNPGPNERYCATCGSVIKERAAVCPECGCTNDGTASEAADFQFCETCGEQIKSDTELCPNCGVRQRHSQTDGLDASTVMLYLLGGFMLLIGLGQITSPGPNILSGLFWGVVFLGLGTILLPAVHERFDDFRRDHSFTTFGTVKSVETYPVSRYEGACTACNSPVDEGVRREFREEFTLFGVVVSSNQGGTNVYCQRCAQAEAYGSHTYSAATDVPYMNDEPTVPYANEGGTDVPSTTEGRTDVPYANEGGTDVPSTTEDRTDETGGVDSGQSESQTLENTEE